MGNGYKYLQIAESLKAEIKSGKLKNESVLPTANKLSEMFRVNKRTVLKAIGDLEKQKLVSPLIGKYRRINRDPGPNGKPYDIAVIGYGSSTKGVYANYSREFFDSLALEFQKHGVFLKMIIIDPEKKSVPLKVEENLSDAYICIGDINAMIVSSINRPLFYFDSSYSSPPNSCCFHMNGEKPVFEAIEHLMEKGHRKIGYVYYLERPQYYHYEEQLTAFRNAINIYGLQRPSGIIEAHSGDFKDNMEKFMNKEFGKIQKLDALILCSSFFVRSFFKALRERQIKVPKDLSIISLGSFMDPDSFSPRLTAFRHNCEKTAEIICQYVFSILKGNLVPISKYTIDVLELVEGESVKKLTGR